MEAIKGFFRDYCDRFNRGLAGDNTVIEGTAASFTDHFLSASPLGVSCGRNNPEFREALQTGYGWYQSIGIKSMQIISVDVTPLDHLHTMAKVRWKSAYVNKAGEEGNIEFVNIYLLQTINHSPKIFAYITPDEQSDLRNAGLI